MKNCVNISFINFQNLIKQNIINVNEVQEIISDNIDKLDEKKLLINKINLDSLNNVLEKELGIDVT